jgi:DNA-directed RNA polymerase specialized sigma24 family protein
MPEALLTREQELDLHHRLIEGDPVAPSDLAIRYLSPLIDALTRANRCSIPDEFIEEAVHLAIMSLCKKPTRFEPSRNRADSPLFAFLQMSAQRDLQNRLKREERHWKARVSLESVEQSPDGGKYLGRDDDPSLPLALREETEATAEILASVRAGLSDGELRCLDLLMQGERKTSLFAQALGIEHLPTEDQEADVKKVKDKLKKRIERRDHG